MNIEHLRKSLKTQWLTYYQQNRSWLTKLGIWVNCEGQRRPSSSFILGTLSTLEPQLVQVLPLVVDLSSNPDRIVMALGLNFNPDEELEAFAAIPAAEEVKLLPSSALAQLPDRAQTVEQSPSSAVLSASSSQSVSKPVFPQPSPPKKKEPEPSFQALRSAPSQPSNPPSEEPLSRPVMDTAEIAPGQQPDRS